MVDVKFGLRAPNFPIDGSDGKRFFNQILNFIGELEDFFDSAWFCDHFIPSWTEIDSYTPMLEGFSSISFFSGIFNKLVWGNIVLCNSYRNPALLAKMGATLQLLTGGRFVLGIGAGWSIDEYIAYGYSFPRAAVRIKQLEEGVQIIRMMWTKSEATFKGKYFEVHGAICSPKPDPIPPIMIGGGGEKLTLRVVAKYADWWNIANTSPKAYLHKLKVLREHCKKVDRDPNEIVKTLATMVAIAKTEEEAWRIVRENPLANKGQEESYIIGDPKTVARKIEEYVDMDVEHFILRFLDFPKTSGAKLFAEEIIPRFSV